ncbi:hypothetical protein RCC89_10205 [Cytophagaceae bacterium ABcell3]|nr:hypothetical protein RCC89_10205 [Cytophagaceae bacterium ABcell3]
MNMSDHLNCKEREYEVVLNSFKESLYKEFHLERLNSKLHDWHKLDFQDFLKEILKTGEKLNYRKIMDWKRFFSIQKEKAVTLEKQIRMQKFKEERCLN